MMQDIIIRQIGTDDVEELQKIAKETFYDTFSPHNTEEIWLNTWLQVLPLRS
jgi:hypothetical protein